jgi:hypothetical protein
MKIRARISIFVELDPEEFPMPVDGDPTDELTYMVEELLGHLDGVVPLSLTVKCSGGE